MADKAMKKSKHPSYINPHDRQDPAVKPPQDSQSSGVFKRPHNGREFTFSNTMIKICQIPTLFMDSSEEQREESHSFLVLVMEKTLKRRNKINKQSQH